MRKAAFTLIECMIVLAIVALLAAIAIPSFLNARDGRKAHILAAEHGITEFPVNMTGTEQLEWVTNRINGVRSYKSAYGDTWVDEAAASRHVPLEEPAAPAGVPRSVAQVSLAPNGDLEVRCGPGMTGTVRVTNARSITIGVH